MVDGEPLYDFAGPTIIELWEHLEELIGLQRSAWNSHAFWENFEYLYRNARRYNAAKHAPQSE